jgi:hypothetical protein
MSDARGLYRVAQASLWHQASEFRHLILRLSQKIGFQIKKWQVKYQRTGYLHFTDKYSTLPSSYSIFGTGVR